MSSSTHVECAQCGEVRGPADGTQYGPCGNCGNTTSTIKMRITEPIGLRASVGLKVKEGGKGTPVLEHKQGWSWFKSGNVWHMLNRRIDRKCYRYFEHIEDEAGNVIRHVDEPLRAHTDRGSAKWKKLKKSPPSS